MVSGVRRKWRIQQVMAVPANWQGTPERFYHFLLGYFVPLVLWLDRTGNTEVTVRDCGPHNPWFELLRRRASIDFLPPGMMLERYLSHRQERVVFHDWDNPTRFHRRSLALARSMTLLLSATSVQDQIGAPRITIIERRPSVDFYHSNAAETAGGAAEWRSVPNIGDVAVRFEELGTVTILDTARVSPEDQISTLLNTDLLVGQHGGGLTNMLWMGGGTSVVEILPPRPPIIDSIFRNLASARELGYQAVRQDHEHAPVDPSNLMNVARRLLANPREYIPTPSGSRLTRLMRQLPRRL